MIVYAASDLHGNLPDVPSDAELLLLAGDICPDFRPYGKRNHWDMVDKGGTQQAHWLDAEFRRWLLEYGVPTIAIWGNHDFVGENPFLVPDLPWTLLQDSLAVHTRQPSGGLAYKIYGTPWVPGLPSWAFYARAEGLRARAEAIPAGIDVLMTHGPPVNAGDFIPTSEKQRNKYNNFGGEHVGDPTLNDAILRARPKVVICGHIHEARGAHSVGEAFEEPGVPVYNVAAVDENYILHEQPWTRLYEL